MLIEITFLKNVANWSKKKYDTVFNICNWGLCALSISMQWVLPFPYNIFACISIVAVQFVLCRTILRNRYPGFYDKKN